MRAEDDGAAGGRKKGVAVGCGLGYHLKSDVARSPAAIVNHHWLPQRLGKFGRKRARHQIGGAADGEIDDQADGFGGPSLS